ncbi:helix-turn-helix domain-containing protein [Bacteroidales bacterium OttesenSCG-928-M11]|nr:helix-turn-helix domain-containing protein [Bacteroidales bacterium OttesenSCG-928-M11]
MKKQNMNLVSKYLYTDEVNELVKSHETNKQEQEKVLSEKEKQNQDIFIRVKAHMEETKAYLNCEYNRKNLVRDVNTNETYLAMAIRYGADMTPHEYINNQRLEHAKKLLVDYPDYTIEQVAADSGFTTLRNFYRLYKKKYEISPAKYRAMNQ